MSTLSLLHDLFSDSLVVFLTMLQAFMAPKNKMPKDAESDYTYVTDEEGAEEPGRSAASGEAPRVHAAKAAPMEAAAFSKAAAVATAKAAAEPAPEAATAGPARPADLAEAKRRIPSPSPSSSVPGPERSPRSRGRREDLPAVHVAWTKRCRMRPMLLEVVPGAHQGLRCALGLRGHMPSMGSKEK